MDSPASVDGRSVGVVADVGYEPFVHQLRGRVSPTPIPVMQPRLPEPEQVLTRLELIQASRTYSNFGPQVTELEARYADFLGTTADRVVSVANATLGIEGAACVADSCHWFVPSFTFAATPAAILGSGGTLEWVDVSATDWWIDDAALRDDSEGGIVAVAPFGTWSDLDRLPTRRDVIIDAAASLGAVNLSLTNLPASWAVVFSLHATKVLPAGEGGIVVFGDATRARQFRTWTNFGFDGRRESMIRGTNAKMSEFAAAFALCSLDGWGVERQDWQRAHRSARSIESRLDLGSVPQVLEQLSPYWIVEFESAEQASDVERQLMEGGIGTRRWWSPCHRMRGFAGLSSRPLPVTEQLAPRVLGLPMFRDLSEEQADTVGHAIEVALMRPEA